VLVDGPGVTVGPFRHEHPLVCTRRPPFRRS